MPIEPYRVRLVVHRVDNAFHARWIEPDGQESETFPLVLPLGDKDKEGLRWYLEELRRLRRRRRPGQGFGARAEDRRLG